MSWDQIDQQVKAWWGLLEQNMSSWIFAIGTFLAIAILVPLIRAAIRRRFDPARQEPGSWRHLIGRMNARWFRLVTLVIAAAVAVMVFQPAPPGMAIARIALIVALTLQAMLFAGDLVEWGIHRIGRAKSKGNGGSEEAELAARSTLTGLRWLALFVLYAFILLISLQNLGVDVTAMVAGLGIGGIAVALAVQNILGDLFASLTIALDKPFVVGDFLVVGSEVGAVEYVGLKTTRVRSLSGEQLVFANSDLLSSRIRNFKRMKERRIVFGFGVIYGTEPDVLEQIPRLVRERIESIDRTRFDRCHFHRFGASSLDFEVVYFVNSPEYNVHMDVQQEILLAIARAFRERGIEFAFPTQTLYLNRQSSDNGHEHATVPAGDDSPGQRRRIR
ncbi:MAG: mechanosensitive ion channel family protein [Phycisphaeraceae bacterium]|nr:mechanosensitive ion channel family protein [Phycisphaeraceae bacterium]